MKLALALLCLLPVATLALDLTPEPDVKILEGVKIPQLKFAHGEGHMTWRPPADWRMSFAEGRLLFLPKEFSFASFELQVLPRAVGDVELLTQPEALTKFCTAYFPKTATGVTLTGGNEGPFTITAIPAHEFLFEFQEPGRLTQASFSIVDLNARERLLVIITAQQKDFAAVRTAAVQSLFTWQGE